MCHRPLIPSFVFALLRSGEGPLGSAGGSASGGVGGRLAHGLIGHDSGGELGLGLLETGISLPVHSVDLSEGRAEGVDTRYGLAVHRHIAHIVRGGNDTQNLISRLLFGPSDIVCPQIDRCVARDKMHKVINKIDCNVLSCEELLGLYTNYSRKRNAALFLRNVTRNNMSGSR